MNYIKKITSETIDEFAEKIERGKKNFIPMLPFVKSPMHDFDRYKGYSDKGVYLIDYVDEDYCLYHLFCEDGGIYGNNALRATLILPSSWEKRFDIVDKSIPNLMEWFKNEGKRERLIIQSLEYGEIEYFPTLSHYLIPTIIKSGFEPRYRMYMRRDKNAQAIQIPELPVGLREIGYCEELFDKVLGFYQKYMNEQSPQYFIDYSLEEMGEMLKQEFVANNSSFIVTDEGSIIAGIMASEDSGKLWIDNFAVSPDADTTDIGKYLLSRTINRLAKAYDSCILAYMDRDCRRAAEAYEGAGFTPFEFWTDMTYEI